MGRKALIRTRKEVTPKVRVWLADLLIKLQEADLENISIDDIARLVGKSKSTIYTYFESKEEIIQAACQTRIDTLTQQIARKDELDSDPIKLYGYFVEVFSEGISDLSISFLKNIKEHYPASWQLIDTFTDVFIKILIEIYKQGMARGQFNRMSVALLAHFDKYFVTQVVTNPSLFDDPDYQLKELVEDYLQLRLEGLMKK